MKKQIRVSVIVTVHNAEPYLRECMDSVCGQTLKEIEILCIDGGSIDASPVILQEYAKHDERVRVINDTNTSYGHKVNRGILEASGEYLAVLESDDGYLPDMLEQLYQIAERYRPDYVNADYLECFEIEGRSCRKSVQMYQAEDYNYFIEDNQSRLANMRQILRYWTGLFRRDFLIEKEIRLNESPGASFQDMSFRFLTSVLADTAYHLNRPVYLYRADNPGSSVADPKKVAVIADEYEFLYRELKKRKLTDPVIWRHYYLWKYHDFRGNMVRFPSEARRELVSCCMKELTRDRKVLQDIAGDSVITDFLRQTPEEVAAAAEEGYQQVQRLEKELKELFWRVSEFQTVIFGCGAYGRRLLELLRYTDGQPVCLADNAAELQNTRMEGYRILSPAQTVEQYPGAFYVIAAKYGQNEMEAQLQRLGVPKERILIYS